MTTVIHPDGTTSHMDDEPVGPEPEIRGDVAANDLAGAVVVEETHPDNVLVPIASAPDAELAQLLAEFGGVAGIRTMLEQLRNNAADERNRLIAALSVNTRCAFTPDELRGMQDEVLRKLNLSLNATYEGQRPIPPAAEVWQYLPAPTLSS